MVGPVYLLGSERSGTNLLRKRLIENQKVFYGPSPAHFLSSLFYREPYYGDLHDDSCFLALIKDALDLCYVHFSPWDVVLEPDAVKTGFDARMPRRSSVLLAHYLMTIYAEAKGYSSYFCKDNFLYEFHEAIRREIPEARFLYLYRDPRDYVLSQLKRPDALRDHLRMSRLWEYEQNKSIRAAHTLRAEGRCYSLSYEDLIQDEERIISEICDFLGVEYGKADAIAGDNIKVRVKEWENLEKSTIKSNFGKYRQELAPARVAQIEAICWQPMRFLGYVPENGSRPVISAFTRLRVFGLAAAGWVLRMWWRNRRAAAGDPIVGRDRLLQRLAVNYRSPK
ncbi:MAG: hypothetical protein K0Q68_1740 [Moraxellaceae bacterium]|jgi:hypothetical protein|nr:hypothetical protein [Moraxellaceae bacterium]